MLTSSGHIKLGDFGSALFIPKPLLGETVQSGTGVRAVEGKNKSGYEGNGDDEGLMVNKKEADKVVVEVKIDEKVETGAKETVQRTVMGVIAEAGAESTVQSTVQSTVGEVSVVKSVGEDVSVAENTVKIITQSAVKSTVKSVMETTVQSTEPCTVEEVRETVEDYRRQDNTRNSFMGTSEYVSPEVLRDQPGKKIIDRNK